MSPIPCSQRSLGLATALGALLGILLVGCQQNTTPGGGAAAPAPPATNGGVGIGPSVGTFGPNIVGAVVNPVGPSKWCYTLESFSDEVTNHPAAGYGTKSPLPTDANGHIDQGVFTKISVKADGCKATISTKGWNVTPGTSFSFDSGTNGGASQVQFCLECDKTNGTVQIEITDGASHNATLGPIAGPQ